MNYRKRMNRGKKPRGTKKHRRFWLPLKKIRGKVAGRYAVAKIHSVTDSDIIMSTSFAVYKIQRKFVPFKDACNRQVQHVRGSRVHTGEYNDNGGYIQDFHWYELEDLVDEVSLRKFMVFDKRRGIKYPTNGIEEGILATLIERAEKEYKESVS